MRSHDRLIRVLHVDDQPEFSEMAANFVEREDDRFDIEIVTTPTEGLQRLGGERIDCIVSDYEMPTQTGIEFLETVREEYPDLPFILYTGKGSEAVASDAISAGVTDYLQKESGTSQYEVLANRILNAVEQRRAREEAAETEQRLQSIAENTNDILWQFTADWNELLFINSPYEEIWGRSIDELDEQPRSFLKGVHPDDRPDVEQAIEMLSAGESADFEFRVNADEDYSRWVWAQGEPIITDTGEVTKVVGFARDITERKTKEQELEDARAEYESLFEASPVPIWVQGLREIYYANEAAAQFHGVDDPAELIGRHAMEFVPEDEIDETLRRNRRMLNEGEPLEEKQGTMVTDDGEHRQAIFSAAPIIYREEQALVAFALDISERKDREARLEAERERFRTLFDQLTQSAVEVKYDGPEPIVQEVNPAFEEAFGYDESTLVGESLDAYIVPKDREDEAKDINKRVREGGRLVSEEVTRLTADGPREFLLQNAVYKDGSGGFAIYTDITDRKEHEQQLQEERRFITQALDTLQDLFYLVSPDGRLRRWNERVPAVTGYTDEQLAGMQAIDLFPDAHHELITEAIEEVITTGEALVEADVITADGDRTPFEFTGSRLTDSDGDLVGVIGIARDITDRKRREAELVQRSELIQALTTTFPDYTFIYNADGEYLDVITGWGEGPDLYTPEELIGQTVEDVVDDETAERIHAAIQTALTTDSLQTIEYPVETPAGTLWYEGSFAPLREGYEGEPAVLLSARDITERKNRERELKATNERLEEFAGVVSHDLRNPLRIVDGRLELARDECDSEHLDAADKALDRMDRIIEDILWLAREGQDIGDTNWTDFQDRVESAWLIVDDTNENAELVCTDNETEQFGRIKADEDRLQQLLENLLRNAIVHGGESVTVRVGRIDDGFYVEDDGPGIPELDRDEVFETDYSTAEHGTGMGLHIVNQIVSAHGWEINVTESAEGGARFEVTGVEFATE